MGENKTPDSQKNTLAELLPGSDNETVIAGNPFEDSPSRSRQSSTTTPSTPTTMQAKHPQPPMKVGAGPPPMGPMPPGSVSGKVYPANQPMVFNPSNPNAPPIYPCGRCHKEVHDNDQGILCESGCNFWFHRICTGLTEPAFTMLKTEIYAEWVCDTCLRTKNIPLVKLKP